MDKACKEPRRLLLYEHGLYEITFNDRAKIARFNQAEICILLDLPTISDIENMKPIEVYKAPPGIYNPPDNYETMSKAEFETRGWKPVKIGKAPAKRHSLYNQGSFAWRKQYGIRNFICCTIHSVMGSTIKYLVTDVTASGGQLWEAAQAVVLLSRTKHLRDIYFIGDIEENIKGLWTALKIRDQYSDLLYHIMDNIFQTNDKNTPFTIRESDYSWVKPKNITLPSPGIPCSYLIVLEPNPNVSYIEYSCNIGE